MSKQGPHFPTTSQRVTPWQEARQQCERQSPFAVAPMPDMSGLVWDEPPVTVVKATKCQQRKAWMKKHSEMEG